MPAGAGLRSYGGNPLRREQGSGSLRPTNRVESAGVPRGQVAAGSATGARTLLISITDGLPTADPTEPLLRIELLDAITIGDVTATAGDAATGTPSFIFKKDGVANGTIDFTGSTGVANGIGNYEADTLLEIYPPAVADATLDDVSISIRVT